MTLTQKILATGILSLLTFQANSQSPKNTQNDFQFFADDHLKTYGNADHISGIALTAQCNWNDHTEQPITVTSGKTGFGDYPQMQSDNISQIGSITKSFTSAVLLMLENDPFIQKKFNFSIEDTVGKYFGDEYPNWNKVTIKQLMNMTSGIEEWIGDKNFSSNYVSNPYRFFSAEEMLSYEKDKPLLFEPGSQWSYSNTNYTLLGVLIKKLTGNDPGIEITNKIIRKLNLKNTYYVFDKPNQPNYPFQNDPDISNKLVHGYYYGSFIDFPQGTETTFFSSSYGSTAGSMISTSEDINTYVRALFKPKSNIADETHLLTQEELNKLTSLVSASDDPEKSGKPIIKPTSEDPVGYGLGIGELYDSKFNTNYYWYAGGTYGFVFEYYYYPDKNITAVVPFNSMLHSGGHHSVIFSNTIDYMMKNCH